MRPVTRLRPQLRRGPRAGRRRTVLLLGGALALVAGVGTGLSGSPATAATVTPAGPAVTAGGTAGGPPSTATCRMLTGEACYTPAQVLPAYGVTPLHAAGVTGAGTTVCVLDSFGSPTIRQDLHHFSAAFGLPDADLVVASPAGPVGRYNGSAARSGWASETTLDVEWAHAVAPGARILLLVTPTAETEGITGLPQMATALRWAVDRRLCDVVSMSFGASEPTFASRAQLLGIRNQLLVPAARSGATLVAASGDTGATDYQYDGVHLFTHRVNSWPSSDPLVTSVGGTTVHLSPTGARTSPDTAWGGQAGTDASGGGLSQVFARPSWQAGVAGVVGTRRGTPDVSMNGAVQSALVTYETFNRAQVAAYGPWTTEAGTSAATPLFAGVVALAAGEAGHRLGDINPALYGAIAHTPNGGAGLVDVTRGSTDVVDHFFGDPTPPMSLRGYPTRRGYDLATGLGTVDASRLVPALAG